MSFAHDLTSTYSPPRGDPDSAAAPRPSPGKRTLAEALPAAATTVQRKAAGAEHDAAAIHASAQRGIATTTSPLPHGDRIQRLFGRHDISGIQAHTGAEAADAARAMGASGYATGNHVVLGAGADLHTAAHEAAHVVQQRGGVQLKGGVGETGDAHEQHADAVADLVVQGKSAEALLDTRTAAGAATHGVQRKISSAGRDLPWDEVMATLGQLVQNQQAYTHLHAMWKEPDHTYTIEEIRQALLQGVQQLAQSERMHAPTALPPSTTTQGHASPGLGLPGAQTVSTPVPVKATADATALSGDWDYNGTYWESTKGWHFYPATLRPAKPDRLLDSGMKPVDDQRLIADLAQRERSRKTQSRSGGTSFSLLGIPRGPARGRELDSSHGIEQNWSPGKSGSGYDNARAHWEKHSAVGGRHHAATSFDDEEAKAVATASYVKHAYEFMATNKQNSFTQKNFTGDGGSAKNVTIYYSSDHNTIAVFDQDMGVLRSFYDLDPSLHGHASNRDWLRASGARV